MSGDRKRRGALVGAITLVVAVATSSLIGSCLVPDDDIQLDERGNAHAVRFVERTALTLAAQCSCSPNPGEACDPGQDVSEWSPGSCPQVDGTGIPHFLDPAVYTLCACETLDTLPYFELFVEDQDTVRNDDGQAVPRDDLYAVALLDFDPDTDDPTQKVRYQTQLPPREELPKGPPLNPLGQEARQLRQLLIGDLSEGLFNPCFENGQPLEPGLHELTIMVTDRFWLSVPAVNDPDVLDPQLGVPDLANGATFDMTRYVFSCVAADDPVCDTSCAGSMDDG